MVDAIGGYFGLELPARSGTLQNGILVNSGRNALEYILRVRGYKHVYIPYYTCDVVLEPFEKLGVSYSFYHVGWNLEPTEFPDLLEDEAFLYTNYFGLMDNAVLRLGDKYGDRLIVDNAQAYFSKVRVGDQFYSPRKFVGVPDGGVVILNPHRPFEELLDLEIDLSYQRMEHMLMRLENGAEFGFDTFQKNRGVLKNQPIKLMSNLTQSLLKSIDFDLVRERRIRNFRLLHQCLGTENELKLDFAIDDYTVPLIYPFCTTRAAELRKRLFSERIYPAQYWPNVLKWCAVDETEYEITKDTLALPIDQRYGEEEMKRIIEIITRKE